MRRNIFAAWSLITLMIRAIAAISLALFLSGCDIPSARTPLSDSRVDALIARIDALEKTSNQSVLRDLLRNMEAVAYLTPGSQGFSAIKSNLGILTISIENVVAYANGSRVTLSIGNPMAASLEGVKAKIEWGKVDKADLEISDTVRSKDVEFVESFRPGSWTKTEVILEGVPPADLGFVRVRNIELTSIKLATR